MLRQWGHGSWRAISGRQERKYFRSIFVSHPPLNHAALCLKISDGGHIIWRSPMCQCPLQQGHTELLEPQPWTRSARPLLQREYRPQRERSRLSFDNVTMPVQSLFPQAHNIGDDLPKLVIEKLGSWHGSRMTNTTMRRAEKSAQRLGISLGPLGYFLERRGRRL